MKIYVAGSSKEIPRVRAAMNALESAGHTITHDWTHSVDIFAGDDARPGELVMCALDDFHGVLWSDCVLLLAPTTQSTGAWVELGLALAANKRIVVGGGDTKTCIFFSHPDSELCPSDEAAIEAIGRSA